MQSNDVTNDIAIDVDNCETHGLGSELQYFSELARTIVLLKTVCTQRSSVVEKQIALEELTHILDKYLEQPLLVAAHIVELLIPVNDILLELVEEKDYDKEGLDFVGKVVYTLCRVAGYKHTVKHFPHEVNHLEQCLALMEAAPGMGASWETVFMLLQWLATLSLIPFDISSMDSGRAGSQSLVARVVGICQRHLADTGPTRDAAAVCLSALLTRPDMDSKHLASFMAWGVAQLAKWSLCTSKERAALTAQYFSILGALQSMFRIFKLGHRSKLQPYGPRLLPFCVNLCEATSQSAARKLLTKLVQRIGMNFLPPRVASWRYMRGSRSLNLQSRKDPRTVSSDIAGAEARTEVDGEAAEGPQADDEDVPEALEDVLDTLLCSLRDKDTVVRWSAAKGIGRIAMRLPKEFASDVVDAVLEAFAEGDADSSWHGGCLTVAELSRRGLLLPERLAAVMPFITRAIRFDVLRGQHSIGAHVRDAACYACWAFSRAYSPQVMAPFIRSITTALLATALFDREVNCRRAASAAYQETVGRQGDQNVPRGIEILTVADYVAVGNRSHCFTSLAAVVADLDAALPAAFVRHLVEVTVRHWDRDMRGLAAKALACLVKGHAAEVLPVLPHLINSCTSSALSLRHGSLVAVGELLLALTAAGAELPVDLMPSIVAIPAAVDKARLYKIKAELMREAVSHLIGCIARDQVTLSVKQQVAFIEALNENLRQPHPDVRQAARDSLRDLLFAHFSAGDDPSERLQKLTVLRYRDGLSDSNAAVARGSALALGALPVRLLVLPEGRVTEVLQWLAEASSPLHKVNGEHDADTSCKAVASVVEVAERLCDAGEASAGDVDRCLGILLSACEDYSVDNRGDTGSWSRVLALKGMESVLYAALRHIQRTEEAQSSTPSSSLKARAESCMGEGVVEEEITHLTGVRVLQLSHPAHSVAWQVLGGLPEVVLQRPGNARWQSRASAGTNEEFLLVLRRRLPMIVEVVLKQLAEKLDAVREVAGAVLLRLMEAFPSSANQAGNPSVADGELLRAAMSRCATAGDDVVPFEELRRSINWANPAHVYPVLCALLDSQAYFGPVLSGLVVSVGGLSETTSKVSARSLLDYCKQCRTSAPDRLAELGRFLVDLLTRNRRLDRIVVPTMKTLLQLVDQGALDAAPAQCKAAMAVDLLAALQGEVRGSSSLSKVRIALELQVRLLSFSPGPARHTGLQCVLAMLTHKYPLIRKYCAEQLYLHLLTCADESGQSGTGPVADGARAAERAVQLLSCTAWESDGRTQLVEARASITRALGFDEAAEALLATEAASTSNQNGRNAVQANADELDSYEALVRDAGY